MTPKARLLQLSSDLFCRLRFNRKGRSRAFLCSALLFIVAQTSTAGLLAGDLPRVPAGFTITRVTTPEMVQHPTMACFDDRGRLYVCESAGLNAKAADSLKDPQDKIVRLEDTDGDGTFDKSVVFADKLVFPQGVLWHEGVVYTCSSPYLWKLEDTDGDGVCDKRTVLVKSFGFSGNAADIHGPFLGPEGRLWWCDGRHGHEIRTDDKGLAGGPDNAVAIPPKPEPGLPNAEGKLLSKGKAARIFNCRLDGSDVQTFCGGGMDNPVEIDFWDTGEVLGTVNLFYGTPRGDCLVHWVWGGVYPKADQQECIDEFPRTVGLLDEVVNYGHVAVSGMCKYRGWQFGAGWDQSVFVTLFNTHKVVRTTLERSGSTFKGTGTEDFVVFDDPDSHPTDVLEDADGSLLVVDTGGWFRIGCPASQVAKPQIGGAIYRVQKVGTPAIKDPYGLQVDWKTISPRELVQLTQSSSSIKSNKAWEELTRRIDSGEIDTKSLGFGTGFAFAIGKAVEKWIAIYDGVIPDDFPIDDLVVGVKEFQKETDPGERRVTYEIAAKLAPLPGVREALAKGGFNATGVVFDDLKKGAIDRVLEHAAINVVLRIADSAAIRPYLAEGTPLQRRIALVALDQIPDANLSRDEVIALLNTADADLQRTVFDVISRREGWAAGVVDLIGQWLADSPLPDDRRAIVRRFLAARASESSVQTLVASQFARADLQDDARRTLLEAISEAEVSPLPTAWNGGLKSSLQMDDVATRQLVIAAALRHKLPELSADLNALIDRPETSAPQRVAAMEVIHVRDQQPLNEARFQALHSLLDDSDPVLQATAARVLADSPLSTGQLLTLVGDFNESHAILAPTLIRAYHGGREESVGQALVKQIDAAGDVLHLPASDLARVFQSYPETVQKLAAPLLASRGVDPEKLAAKLATFTEATKAGNARNGREVFFSNKALCSRCHRVNNLGETIGPDLSMVGAIRQHHELVEAVIEPSASFVRSYRPVVLVTTDGKVHTGIIAGESSTEVTLRTADFAEIRVKRSDIEAFKESDVSIMPAGLEQRLTKTELADLVAFLASLKERK